VGENATNNRAEYAGLILGLQQAAEYGIKNLHVQGDSQLVINQIKGIYQCASPNLVSLYERAKELENNFEKIKYEHVLRHLNKRADYLSNVAIMDYKP
jgi:ribonuclease HI